MMAPSAAAVDTLSTVSDLLASMARAGPMRPRSGSVTGPLRLKPELWTGAAVAVAVGTLSFSPAVTAEGQFSPAVTAEGQLSPGLRRPRRHRPRALWLRRHHHARDELVAHAVIADAAGAQCPSPLNFHFPSPLDVRVRARFHPALRNWSLCVRVQTPCFCIALARTNHT